MSGSYVIAFQRQAEAEAAALDLEYARREPQVRNILTTELVAGMVRLWTNSDIGLS